MEFDGAGRTMKIHAAAVSDDGSQDPLQHVGFRPRRSARPVRTGMFVRTVVRCGECAEALGTPDALNVW
jgi:hypothetical protein